MSKILITGGCSFSECISTHIDTWPRHLAKSLSEYKHISTGLGSQGNGLISKKIIYNVSQLLKTENPENLLVGIMWSGTSRHEIYSSYFLPGFERNNFHWQVNPSNIVENSKSNWYIFNHHWEIPIVKEYYRKYYDEIGNTIASIENILRVQWFLKNNNVRYFMSTFMDEVLDPKVVNHIDVKYLHDMIDMDQFLPVSSEYDWCKNNSSFQFPNKDDPHPGTEQHGEFTEKVILPFLKQKGYIG